MSCTDIKTDAKFALLKEDDITWFCTPCRGLAVQAAQTDKLIDARNTIRESGAERWHKTQTDEVTGELKADVFDLREQGLETRDRDTTVLKEQTEMRALDGRNRSSRATGSHLRWKHSFAHSVEMLSHTPSVVTCFLIQSFIHFCCALCLKQKLSLSFA